MSPKSIFPAALALAAGVALVSQIGAGDESWAADRPSRGPAPSVSALESLYDTHDHLATTLQRLRIAATGPSATPSMREAFIEYVRGDVQAQLDLEAEVLYTAFDSVTGSSFATTGALFDRQHIERLVQDLDRARGFAERSYATAAAIENYFTKTESWITPVLAQRLGDPGVSGLLGRLVARTNP